MLSEEAIERLTERLAIRVEEGNLYVLKRVGEAIKHIASLNPTQARNLAQILKYGGDYDKIAKKLAEITELNLQDIQNIFEEVAKKDYKFAEQFYKYKGRKFIPYKDNEELQRQVKAFAKMQQDNYLKYANATPTGLSTRAVGYSIGDKYYSVKEAYEKLIDDAVINIAQGKDTFYGAMEKELKEIGSSGLVHYESGYSRRLDSSIYMNINTGLNQLHDTLQEKFGKEFGADGVEISCHEYPAPDHQEVQGRQFSHEEYQKLQDGLDAKGYNGNTYTLQYSGKTYRPIGEYNCYHYTFQIVLGVNEPAYSEKQLKDIQARNEKGFELDGKHYTMYEGTQLQRKLELQSRRLKETKTIAESSGDNKLLEETNAKIRYISKKYKELSKISNLQTKMERMKLIK